MKAYRTELKIDDVRQVVAVINQEEEEVVTKTVKAELDRLHHILIIDRSGSMSWAINSLIDQVEEAIDTIRKNDIVSVIWFSSPGQYKVVLKGVKRDKDLKQLLQTLRSTIALTCFNEAIAESKQIAEDLAGVCKNVVVTLFTDGQSCGIDERTDFENSAKVISEMKQYLLAFNTIGYGNYCNEKFLFELSKISTFGTFTHSDRIESFKEIFVRNFEKVELSVVGNVEIKSPHSKIIYLTRNNTKMNDHELSVDFLDSQKNQFFIFESNDFTFKYNDRVIETAKLPELSNDATLMNFFYAYSLNLLMDGQKALATNILGKKCFDKFLVDTVGGAFTKSERENAKRVLEDATFSTSARWIEGKCPNNYLPAKDAHCVLDILFELSNGFGYYVPFHKESEEYKRIGVKIVDKVGTFQADRDVPTIASMQDFVFNSTRANISIKVPTKGSVNLKPEDSVKVGQTSFDCIDFKNYTIVKDGTLNMQTIVVVAPTSIYNSLIEKKTITKKLTFDKNVLAELKAKHGETFVCFGINFTNKPMINRLYLDSGNIMPEIASLEDQIRHAEAFQKVINHYIDTLYAENANAEKEGIFKKLTQEQIEICKAYGLTSKGWYYGKGGDKVKSGDVITFREIEFVYKNFSSLPSMKDLLAGKKTDTPSGKLMLSKKDLLDTMMQAVGLTLDGTNFKTRDWLNAELSNVKKMLNSLRYRITMIKLTKVLNGDWFDGLKVDAKGNEYFETGSEILYLKSKFETEVI